LFLVPFAALGILYSLPYVRRSWQTLEMSPNPGGLPRYPIKAVIVVAFAMLILQALSETIRNAAFLSGRKGSGSVHESPPAAAGVAHRLARSAGLRARDGAGLMLGLWMFAVVVVLLLIGFPVAFTLGGTAVLFTLLGSNFTEVYLGFSLPWDAAFNVARLNI